mmetsp:Transcript_3852/g.7467  ORF Transcript_3852/g.7467 Transcript_3852/m.7467 type:complete len:249 (+) Transcript_3852:682-1428(+)
MVMGNLPLSILVFVDEGVSGFNLIPEEIELVDSSILAPVGSNHNVGLKNDSLRFLQEECIEIIFDRIVIRSWDIRHGGKENARLGITLRDGIGIQSGEGVVPKMEKTSHLILCNGFGDVDSLGHDRGVVVSDLPLVVFEHVHVSVSGFYNVASCSHCELVDSCVLCPPITNANITLQNLTLRLLLKKRIEVILNASRVSTRRIAHGRKQNRLLGITLCHNTRISRGEGAVPKAEQSADLRFFDGLVRD